MTTQPSQLYLQLTRTSTQVGTTTNGRLQMSILNIGSTDSMEHLQEPAKSMRLLLPELKLSITLIQLTLAQPKWFLLV